MADAARPQNGGEFLVLAPAHVPFASGEHGPYVVIAPAVAAVRQIIGRVIEVRVLAVPAVEEALDVERAAHGDAAGDLVGMAEGEVHGMVSAKAAAGHDGARSPILVPHQRQHVIQDVALVLQMPLYAPVGMRPLVVPAFAVYAIDAIDRSEERRVGQ